MAYNIRKCINIELESPLGSSKVFIESREARNISTRYDKLEAHTHRKRPDVYSNKSRLLLQVLILLTVDIHLRIGDLGGSLMSKRNVEGPAREHCNCRFNRNSFQIATIALTQRWRYRRGLDMEY